jgi:hypothetical protein
MKNKFGYPLADWEKAKQEMRELIIEHARSVQLLSYSDLVRGVRAIQLQMHSDAMAAMLGEISSEEDAAGRGMLTAIVVDKSDLQRPGAGFFTLAKRLGRDTSDPERFWITEVNRVHQAWRN